VSANAYPANPLDTELYGGSELVPRALACGAWDGVVLPYVPAPLGGDVVGLPLSREYDTDIDPVTYQVLRWRLRSASGATPASGRGACTSPVPGGGFRHDE
jgi:hypothetical protein